MQLGLCNSTTRARVAGRVSLPAKPQVMQYPVLGKVFSASGQWSVTLVVCYPNTLKQETSVISGKVHTV